MFNISNNSLVPVHVQLEEQIHLDIHSGELRPGARLPTVRNLAVQLGINANTVARVYRDLKERGFLRLERGRGTFVAETQPECPLAKADVKKIRSKTRYLVSLCHRVGLSRAELAQLIDDQWKEKNQ